MRITPAFLATWIILSIPSAALFQEQFLFTLVLAFLGLAGMMTINVSLVSLSYGSLLLLTVWGKIASDIYGLPGPDTALLLLQFMSLVFFMEASLTTLKFDDCYRPLKEKSDEFAGQVREQLINWVGTQLLSLGQLTLAAYGLSLGLLVFGSLVSVSFNQIAFSGALVLVVVATLLVLLTYRREPETRRK
jgi:hypothetical protein